MTDTDNHDSREGPDQSSDGERAVETDGGAVSQAAQDHQQTDYLRSEVNLLSPSTPFMRDHLKIVWGTFVAWVLVVWGPVTLTYVAPEAMQTQIPVVGFPLHYFLVALGAPTGSLVLAVIYARLRDNLDERYGINPTTVESTEPAGGAAATDGGVEE
jgi:putative solute:sodium symporter small subunit